MAVDLARLWLPLVAGATGVVVSVGLVVRRVMLRLRVLRTIGQARQDLLDAVRRARLDGDPLADSQKVAEVIGVALQELAQIEEAASRRGSDTYALQDRALSLCRLRARVLPLADIEAEGLGVKAELLGWGIVNSSFDEMERNLRAGLAPSASEAAQVRARATFARLLEEYDDYRSQVEGHFTQMAVVVYVLFTLSVVGLVSGLKVLAQGQVVSAFLLAGTAGTAVSIMLKLPRFVAQGQRAWFMVRTVARLSAGIMASAVGCGLLASGLLSVALPIGDPPVTMAEVLRICGQAPLPEGEPPPLGAGCGSGWAAVLVALAMLLGFSERFVGSFEQVLFAVTKMPAQAEGRTEGEESRG